MLERDVQRSRAAQVGILMRSYRESFSPGDGRRGLTQEALLERMGSVDKDYAERYSHATVSRWESGGTRPTLQRLKVFGAALDLSRTEVAGLVLLAGLALDFRAALGLVTGSDGDETIGHGTTSGRMSVTDFADGAAASATEGMSSILRAAIRFAFFRILPLGLCIVGVGYALSLLGWNDALMPTAYVAFVTGLVLAQGFLLPDRDADLREFFWVSLFFLLTTPLLQFAPIRMDHYNFYTIGNLAGSQMPYMLALLFNLLVASAAGLMFQLLRKWQSPSDSSRSALRRAAWVTLPPVLSVYAVVAVITNISVSIQLAILLPVLGAVFATLVVLRDPTFNPSERDRLFLLSTASVLAMVSTTVGIVAVLSIYLSPDFPRVLPDHNLLRSWEIDFAGLGYSREEALDRVNFGYLWHTTWVFAYMFFVVGGNLIVTIYRIDVGRRRSETQGQPQPHARGTE